MSDLIVVNQVAKSFKVSKRQKGVTGMLANLIAPKFEKKVAVKEMSFTIQRGEMVGFIGPNGAGKSTTIKMLSGILAPEKGNIVVNGLHPYKNRRHYVGQIGVVFGQKSQLQWDLPVIDSFELLKAIYCIPENLYRQNLNKYTEMLDMSGFINQPVRQLSLGQRMRADIVAALLHSPKIVFFDEPTIGVDVVGKEMIRKFIRELNEQEQITMIFTTHDMQDIVKTCKRLIIIDKGSKVYDGSIENIREIYGTTRQLDVEFQEKVAIAPIENVVIQELRELDGRKMRFIFENKHVKIDQLMHQLLTHHSIKDINVTEPEIESLIQKIYTEEVIA